MDALIYTLMSGAERSLRAQQVHANNLANLDTPGFRADLDLALEEPVAGSGFDARHMARLETGALTSRTGTVKATGRDLDVAVQGAGFLVVQAGNGEAYTRSGAIRIDADGQLNIDGRPLLGDGGPIVLPPYQKVAIGVDGTISIQAAGETAMQAIDKLKLVKAADGGKLTKNEAGLIVARDGQPLPADETVQVQGGHLEGSNVSAIEEMVATMSLNRDFEVQMKLYKAADSMAEAGNRLIRE